MPSCHSAIRTLLRKWSQQPPVHQTQCYLRQQHLARSYTCSPSLKSAGAHSDEVARSRPSTVSSLDADSSYLDLILGHRDGKQPAHGHLHQLESEQDEDEDGYVHGDLPIHTSTASSRRGRLRTGAVTTAASTTTYYHLKRPPATKAETQTKRLPKKGGLQRQEETAAGIHINWRPAILRLVRRYRDIAANVDPGPRIPPTIAPEAIDEAKKAITELDKLEVVTIGSLQHSIEPSLWSQALLWILYHDYIRAPDFLLATYKQVYRRNICIQDSLQYLALRFSLADDGPAVSKLVDVAFAISKAWTAVQYLHGNWQGRWYFPIIQHCETADLVRLFDDLSDLSRAHRVQWATWLHFATNLAKRDHFDRALNAILKANAAGASLDSYAFRSCSATLLRKSIRQPGGLRACIRIVDNLVKIGLPLNDHLATIIMLNAVEAGDLKTAFSIYHSLVDHGLKANEYTFAVLLKGCKASIDDADLLNTTIRDALAHIDVHKSPLVSTEILHCLALHHTKHNLDRAFDIITDAYAQLFDLRALQQIGLLPSERPQSDTQQVDRPSPSYYDMYIMIATYLEHYFSDESPDVRAAHELYQRFKTAAAAGAEPFTTMAQSDHTFNAFLCTFIKSKRGLLYAAELVKDMQGKKRVQDHTNYAPMKPFCEPTVYTWSIFVDGFTRHGQMSLAEQVLTYMRSKGIEPNRVTYNTLVRGYAMSQQAEGMIDALRRMESDGNTWDDWTVKGTQKLRDQTVLDEELKRQRQAQALDFTADLRGGLEQRLAEAQMEPVTESSVPEESDAERTDREHFQTEDDPTPTPRTTETSYVPIF